MMTQQEALELCSATSWPVKPMVGTPNGAKSRGDCLVKIGEDIMIREHKKVIQA